MKNYEEVAKSVFEKSEKYFEEKAIRAKHIKTAMTAMSCFCLAAVIIVAAAAALNSNLTEYPTGGGADSAVTEYTTTAIYPEETSAETESLYTMPEMLTDENGDPVYPDIDIPDDIWENDGDYFSNGIPGENSDYIWQIPEEILGTDYDAASAEEATNWYIAYDGAFYTVYSPEDEKTGRYYAATGTYAYYHHSNSPCEVYAVKDEPNLIAIITDSTMCEYRRLCYVDFEIDGEKYEIAYPALMQNEYDCGEKILETEDYTVYEAVSLQGEPSDTKEYLINLLPVLKRDIPNLDDLIGDNDYPLAYIVDAWWVALPIDTAGMLSHVDIQDDAPSLPPNTLTGVTPGNIDKILAETKAAPYLTPYSSVFVQANIGDEVYSLTDGVVVMKGWNAAGGGKTVIVQTADGDYIMYSHLSEIYAKKGDPVAPAKIIGLAGNTGATAYSGVAYVLRTSLPVPEKCAVIFPEIPEERTEAELIEEIEKLGISVTFVWSDDIDERIIPMEENAEVFSLTDGEVMWTYEHGTANNTVCVRYSMDTYVFYNHLSGLTVEKGDTVTEGQCIGHAGDIEFIDDIFDFGAGYRLSHTYYEHSASTDETHHDDEAHHSNNETHHGLIS